MSREEFEALSSQHPEIYEQVTTYGTDGQVQDLIRAEEILRKFVDEHPHYDQDKYDERLKKLVAELPMKAKREALYSDKTPSNVKEAVIASIAVKEKIASIKELGGEKLSQETTEMLDRYLCEPTKNLPDSSPVLSS